MEKEDFPLHCLKYIDGKLAKSESREEMFEMFQRMFGKFNKERQKLIFAHLFRPDTEEERRKKKQEDKEEAEAMKTEIKVRYWIHESRNELRLRSRHLDLLSGITKESGIPILWLAMLVDKRSQPEPFHEKILANGEVLKFRFAGSNFKENIHLTGSEVQKRVEETRNDLENLLGLFNGTFPGKTEDLSKGSLFSESLESAQEAARFVPIFVLKREGEIVSQKKSDTEEEAQFVADPDPDDRMLVRDLASFLGGEVGGEKKELGDTLVRFVSFEALNFTRWMIDRMGRRIGLIKSSGELDFLDVNAEATLELALLWSQFHLVREKMEEFCACVEVEKDD